MPRRAFWKRPGFGVVAALLMIAAWFVIGGFGALTFRKLDQVMSTDQTRFLPESAEPSSGQQSHKQFAEREAVPAIVLVAASRPLGRQTLQHLQDLKAVLQDVDGVAHIPRAVVGPIRSPDKKAAQFIVQIGANAQLQQAVTTLRATVEHNLPDRFDIYVTGRAGVAAALNSALDGVDGVLLIVALTAVLVILLLVYRSVVLPLIVLATAMLALCAAILAVYYLARAGIVSLNGRTQGILFILVIGAATDYSLLLVARYRESLGRIRSKWPAILAAYKGSFKPIAASAATVIAALLCLLASSLDSNQSLGPSGALGIAAAFLAVMTLLPGLLVLIGRRVFWPLVPRFHEPAGEPDVFQQRELWARVAQFVGLYPRQIWIVSVLALAACALGITQLQTGGVPLAQSILSPSNAVKGQQVLQAHYPAAALAATTIKDQSAAQPDITQAARADLRTVAPLALAVILVILMLLLRSIVAALVLIGSVALSFLATLGVSAVVFTCLFDFPSLAPTLVLYSFIFLLALGVDYNIFLMSRVREEAGRATTRTAVLRGLRATGGVITSAGIVLAATFAALAVIPILFLVQLAFIVAFGVLLDTIIIRSLLLPAAVYDIGNAVWWPGSPRWKT